MEFRERWAAPTSSPRDGSGLGGLLVLEALPTPVPVRGQVSFRPNRLDGPLSRHTAWQECGVHAHRCTTQERNFSVTTIERENRCSQGGSVDQVKIEEVLAVMRPLIQQDGGDIFLRGVYPDTGLVEVELVGACVSCPASTQTLKAGIERILKDRVPGVLEVVNIGEVSDGVRETAVTL